MDQNAAKQSGKQPHSAKQQRPVWALFIVGVLKICLMIYDLVLYIPIKIFMDTSSCAANMRRVKAKPVVANDPRTPWRKVNAADQTSRINEIFPGCSTIGKVWDECVKRFGVFDCFGVREVLSVENEVQKNGRIFKKMELGKYHWMTYNDVGKRVDEVSRGLKQSGQQVGNNVVIFSETCAEWMTTALACFKCNFPVATVYTTLGPEALSFAIQETNATTIFVSHANISKVAKIMQNCESIKTIVYYESLNPSERDHAPSELHDTQLQLYSFQQLIDLGQKMVFEIDNTTEPDSLAMIMYTSGTTGNPKGVLITHRNMVAAIRGQSEALSLRSDDVGIAYLPLAHILEICAELNALIKGCKIGYASSQTLLDQSSMLKKGQIGDFCALKPTLIACVPMIMNRIQKAVNDQISRSSPLMQEIFNVCYERKRKQYLNGYPRSLLNTMVFDKIRNVLGGNIRVIVSGSAPLSAETQIFMSVCFNCPVVQGYGLTETTGGGTVCDVHDRSTGTVGPPAVCCEIMLKEWEEAGYSPANEKPQGEVLISGDSITLGYLNNEEKNRESFVEIDGKRWFATGDIGEFRDDGSLCIIDRKKDLIKLSHGEYISLGKVESVILSNPYVESVCVFAGFNKSYMVALIVPNYRNLQDFVKRMGIDESDKQKLCEMQIVHDELFNDIQNYTKDKLHRVEVPQKIHLCAEMWTPSNDLVTEGLKLKRKNIELKYKDAIRRMYDADD